MARYLMTHSLLSSWLYAMKENPYEDLSLERNPFEDFMKTLRREPSEPTEAMQKGINFENLVTAITDGNGDVNNNWYEAAERIASVVRGGQLQYKAFKDIKVGGLSILLYGRLDALKAGVIYDIKYCGSYDKGKYISSTQHPVYLELIPEAKEFTYLVSNGSSVWTETYRRDETPSINPIISDFMDWLSVYGLLDIYKEKWLSA